MLKCQRASPAVKYPEMPWRSFNLYLFDGLLFKGRVLIQGKSTKKKDRCFF